MEVLVSAIKVSEGRLLLENMRFLFQRRRKLKVRSEHFVDKFGARGAQK